jgi:hypothetical protein
VRRTIYLLPQRWKLMFAIFFMLALSVMLPFKAMAQSVLSTPYVAACPSPVPPTWPASTCKYVFELPDVRSPEAVASISKLAPVYTHTYSGYVVGKFAGVIVACPKNAVLSADKKSCMDAAGKDASGLVTLSSLPTFSITAQSSPPPPPPPPPPAVDYTVVTGYTIEQSYDAGSTWDAISTTIGYPKQSAAHCFRVTAVTVTGKGPPQVVCPEPK